MARTKLRIYSVILGLSLLLLASKSLHAEPTRVTEDLRRERVFLPSSAPNKSKLILVSFTTIQVGADIAGTMAMYDDPQTERPMDYMELYDGSGGLLLISWIDRFGIRRTAMDRGLLQEEASKLEGVLILLLEGTLS